MDKFRNNYRIPSARLINWDYTSDGVYFITICTKNRLHHFGECKNGKLKLSIMGLLVQGCWFQIQKLSPHVTLGEFVVMPNHIHGILILNSSLTDKLVKEKIENKKNGEINQFMSDISPKSGSVSRIIGTFKSFCSRYINQIYPELCFEWQERFWDNVIKDEESFIRISNYIINNPKNWKDDKFFDNE